MRRSAVRRGLKNLVRRKLCLIRAAAPRSRRGLRPGCSSAARRRSVTTPSSAPHGPPAFRPFDRLALRRPWLGCGTVNLHRLRRRGRAFSPSFGLRPGDAESGELRAQSFGRRGIGRSEAFPRRWLGRSEAVPRRGFGRSRTVHPTFHVGL